MQIFCDQTNQTQRVLDRTRYIIDLQKSDIDKGERGRKGRKIAKSNPC